MIDKVVGATLGIKLVNGKIRPKYGMIGKLFTVLIPIIILIFVCAFIHGVTHLDIEFMITTIMAIFGFSYFMFS